MNESILLDPTAENAPAERARLPRPDNLNGKVVGLLDISKPRGNVFLDRIEEQLSAFLSNATLNPHSPALPRLSSSSR